MQISTTPQTSPAPASGSSNVVEMMKHQAAVLADGSGASDQEKLDAYKSILSTMNQSSRSGAGWFQQSTQADRDAVNAIMDNSAMSKRVLAAADALNQFGMSQPRETNATRATLEHLNGMPSFEQDLAVAGTFEGGVEAFKSFLQVNAAGRDEQIAADKAEKDAKANKSAVTVTLSDKAKAALSQVQGADDAATSDTPAAAAVAALSKTDQGDSIASAALRMLQKAAESRVQVEDHAKNRRAEAETANSNRAYEVGDNINTSI